MHTITFFSNISGDLTNRINFILDAECLNLRSYFWNEIYEPCVNEVYKRCHCLDADVISFYGNIFYRSICEYLFENRTARRQANDTCQC